MSRSGSGSTTPTSGSISLQQVMTTLGIDRTINLGHSAVQTAAGKDRIPSRISMSELYGISGGGGGGGDTGGGGGGSGGGGSSFTPTHNITIGQSIYGSTHQVGYFNRNFGSMSPTTLNGKSMVSARCYSEGNSVAQFIIAFNNGQRVGDRIKIQCDAGIISLFESPYGSGVYSTISGEFFDYFRQRVGATIGVRITT